MDRPPMGTEGMSRRDFLLGSTSALCIAPLWPSAVGGADPAVAAVPAASVGPEKYFEAAFGVTDADLKKIISTALTRGGDYCDVYFQHAVVNQIVMDDGKINKARMAVSLGMGVRVLIGERTGYAFSQALDMKAMLEAARTAALLAVAGAGAPGKRGVEVGGLKVRPAKNLYPMQKPWDKVPTKARMELLKGVGRRLIAAEKSIKRTRLMMIDSVSRIMFADSRGLKRADTRPGAGLAAMCVAEQKGRRESDGDAYFGQAGLEMFTLKTMDAFADKLAAAVRRQFEAKPIAGGRMPCVLAPGSSGILLHEAIGHGLEADFNRRNISTFADRMNKKVANEQVTIVDDGTIPAWRGSINFDDEGNDSRRTVLVDKGILRSYMHDRISAAHYQVAPTGSGRRQSFEYAPMPRMRVTYMESGPYDPREIIGSVKKGLYAERFTNGQVRIGAGDFTFYVKSGYAIENGKLTHPVKDVNVIGNGPEVLSRMTMVGNDKTFSGVGWRCGKSGQGVPASLGLPTTLVSEINVGGASG